MEQNKKTNWQDFKQVLERHGIKKLYHYTDRDNIESIIQSEGLYSWADCEDGDINIPKPGGDDEWHEIDKQHGLERYVRLSFTTQNPMMYIAQNQGRITNPVILEISTDVVFAEDTLFADCEATSSGANVGGTIDDFNAIHFDSVKASKQSDLQQDEQPFFEAEVLVNHCVPLRYITNISNFGLPVPNFPNLLVAKTPYTAQITRATPTAFIFLIDQSCSMEREVTVNGQTVSLADVVANIVNNQINELVLRCIKTNEVRHYYDIALIGYGVDAYSGWSGNLEGRFFVSPKEIMDNPAKKVKVVEEVKTRRGIISREIEKTQWLLPRADGNWTHLHKAFSLAKMLLEKWMIEHHDQDCYPPTIINITDGEFNGIDEEDLMQEANELKAIYTNDGNVLLFNIHISPDNEDCVAFPVSEMELNGDEYAESLYRMSSLLPLRYNADISQLRGDANDVRHSAMSVNADSQVFIKFLEIGTPTNINQSR